MYIQLSANQMNTRVSLIDLQTDTGVHLVCTQLYVRHHSLKTSKNQRFCSECFFFRAFGYCRTSSESSCQCGSVGDS